MQEIINKNIYKTITFANAIMYKSIFIVFSSILILVILYVYFVGSAIVSTVVYKESRIEIANLHSELAGLETEYIKHKQQLTKDLAVDLGFQDLNDKKYITRTIVVGRAD